MCRRGSDSLDAEQTVAFWQTGRVKDLALSVRPAMLAQKQTRRRRVGPRRDDADENHGQPSRTRVKTTRQPEDAHDVSSDRFFLSNRDEVDRNGQYRLGIESEVEKMDVRLTSGPIPLPSTAATTWFVTTTAIPY